MMQRILFKIVLFLCFVLFFVGGISVGIVAGVASNTSAPQNIGSPVNSGFNEFAPSLTADGKTMVFNSKRENAYYQDLYITEWTGNGWSEPRPLTRLNSPYNDETPAISADGNLIVFASDRDESFALPRDENRKVRVSFDLYWSHKVNGEWSHPQKVPLVNTIHHERAPALSLDGNFLYYMSWPFGQTEKISFHRARLTSLNNKKSVADKEVLDFPVEGKYLSLAIQPAVDKEGFYFAAKLPDSLGEWDLYFISYQNNVFGKPQNLGPTINSEASEIYFSVIPHKNGVNTIYFCSNRSGGFGQFDIYGANLPSLENKIYRVRISDKKNKKPLVVEFHLQDDSATNVSQYTTNEQGISQVSIAEGQDAQLNVMTENYLPYNKIFTTTELAGILKTKEGYIDVELEQAEQNSLFSVNNIHFEVDSATLTTPSKSYLQKLADYLKKNSRLKIEIIGHTDLTGSKDSNKTLSENRAQSVKAFLVKEGITANRLTARGEGMQKPLIKATNFEANRLNRRTEFRITEKN